MTTLNDRYIIASPRPGRYLSSTGSTASKRTALRWNDSDRAEAALRAYQGNGGVVRDPELLLATVDYTAIPVAL